MGEKISCIGILTCASHAKILEKWCKDLCISLEVREVEQSSKSIKDNLQEFEALGCKKIVIDDSALKSEEDEIEVRNYLGHLMSRGIDLVFVGKPERNKDDKYVEQIFNLGVTNLLLQRYYQSDVDSFKEIFLKMLKETYTEEKLDKLFETYPEAKKRKLFGKEPEIELKDVLNEASSQLEISTPEATFKTEEELMEHLKNKAQGKEPMANSSDGATTVNNSQSLNYEENDKNNNFFEKSELTIYSSSPDSIESNHIEEHKNYQTTEIFEKKLDELFSSLENRIEQVEKNCMQEIAHAMNSVSVSTTENKTKKPTQEKLKIAITGMGSCGKTRLAFELAFAFKEVYTNQEVDLVLNNRDVQSIRQFLEIKDGKIVYKGITILSPKDTAEANILISDIGNSNYVVKNNNLTKTFKEADCRIVVFSGEPWQIDKIGNLIKEFEALNDDTNLKTIFCNNNASNTINNLLQSYLEEKTEGKETIIFEHSNQSDYFDENHSVLNNQLLQLIQTIMNSNENDKNNSKNSSEVADNE